MSLAIAREVIVTPPQPQSLFATKAERALRLKFIMDLGQLQLMELYLDSSTPTERRRLQNRLAQRRYRGKLIPAWNHNREIRDRTEF